MGCCCSSECEIHYFLRHVQNGCSQLLACNRWRMVPIFVCYTNTLGEHVLNVGILWPAWRKDNSAAAENNYYPLNNLLQILKKTWRYVQTGGHYCTNTNVRLRELRLVRSPQTVSIHPWDFLKVSVWIQLPLLIYLNMFKQQKKLWVIFYSTARNEVPSITGPLTLPPPNPQLTQTPLTNAHFWRAWLSSCVVYYDN